MELMEKILEQARLIERLSGIMYRHGPSDCAPLAILQTAAMLTEDVERLARTYTFSKKVKEL